jgi:hypothetical protein
MMGCYKYSFVRLRRWKNNKEMDFFKTEVGGTCGTNGGEEERV